MSQLTELLRRVRQVDPQLGADLEAQIRVLTKRRTFGLVFEQYEPEAVELAGRAVRRGDKVRVLPPRGETKVGDPRVWQVERIERADGQRVAHLVESTGEESEPLTVLADDLVVVAEFRDRIYPGLIETGRVERGGDKPFHTVINSENAHALEMLTYTHRHSVDAIYIDPPYNSGAKDWKYNNNYVESDDDYRHSKWLAMMERRLKIARELLNPNDSVLIVTIDEKEYLRLGLLLEQTFPDARIQMVSIATSPSGASREQAFRRSDEYAFFAKFGVNAPTALPLGSEWQGAKGTSTRRLRWNGLMRSGTEARRADRESMFYPILLDRESGTFAGVGEALPLAAAREDFREPDGTVAVWPVRSDGSEGRWQVGPEAAKQLQVQGFLKIGRFRGAKTAISYLKAGEQKKLRDGVFGVGVRSEAGHVVAEGEAEGNTRIPTTQWSLVAHSAADHGSTLLRALVPTRNFPFPKSLYAVEDTLRFFVKNRPDAVVLDFFSGSGTTAHAVMRLNRQDGGRRQCISVTNNEVSAEEQSRLRAQGLRPGDAEWEALGICDYVTKPRISAAMTGTTPSGKSIKGDYKFTDEFPMSDGLEENAAYFTLTYEALLSVRHNRAFERIAPILWLRAGSRGRIISDLGEDGWDVAETYAVLENLDQVAEFNSVLEEADGVTIAYVVTDDDSAFQMVCRDLPSTVVPVRLYESYLHNFEINSGRSL